MRYAVSFTFAVKYAMLLSLYSIANPEILMPATTVPSLAKIGAAIAAV